MKINIVLFFISFSGCFYAQLKPGFSPLEAKEMIAICNSFSYLELYGDDATIIPTGYRKVYTSSEYGMDNKFQIYTHDQIAVLHFRGSTEKKSSWLENLYSAMIPVEGTIQINKDRFPYKVGSDSSGAVHAGYVLAMAFLEGDVVHQIKALNERGIYNILITGHSQGGALAQMIRAYLDYLPNAKLSKRNVFKVYAFGNPMIGNVEFAKEYNRKYSAKEMSFLLHNPEDFVPKMPMTYNDTISLKSSVQRLILDRENTSLKEVLMAEFLQSVDYPLMKTNFLFAHQLNKEIGKDLGKIVMPRYKKDINYAHTAKPLLIPITIYPLALKDSSILFNDSILALYPRDENGVFEDKSVYVKRKSSLQHKPYNYYTALIQLYFPEEYDRLPNKYFMLPEENE